MILIRCYYLVSEEFVNAGALYIIYNDYCLVVSLELNYLINESQLYFEKEIPDCQLFDTFSMGTIVSYFL